MVDLASGKAIKRLAFLDADRISSDDQITRKGINSMYTMITMFI